MAPERLTIGVVRLSVDENQANRKQLIRHLQALGDAGCDHLFYDIASRTASIAERPGLQQAIALIETGVVEKVLIPDVERLTANQVVLEEIKAIARRHQCQILPGNLGIDLCSDIGGLLGSIAAAGATYELSRIRNRQTRGTDYEQERNLWRGAVRFGFTRQDGKIVPSTKPFLCLLATKEELHTAAIARHQVELFLKLKGSTRTVGAIHDYYGISLPSIVVRPMTKNHLLPNEIIGLQKRHFWAISIFRWSEGGLIDWLTDPVLAGGKVLKKQEIIDANGKRVKYLLPREDWEIDWNNHTGIISRETHEQIMGIIASHRSIGRGSNSYAHQNWFKGLVFCQECGSQCRLQGNGGKHNQKFGYQCCLYIKERYQRKINPDAVLNCTNRTLTRNTLIEDAVIAKLKEHVKAIAAQAKHDMQLASNEPEAPEVVELRSQIHKYEKMNDPDLGAAIEAKKLKLSKLLSNATVQKQERRNKDSLILRSFQDEEFWRTMAPDQKQEAAFYLVERVEVLGGKVMKVELR